MDAISAAVARPSVTASTICCGWPAPPESDNRYTYVLSNQSGQVQDHNRL